MKTNTGLRAGVGFRDGASPLLPLKGLGSIVSFPSELQNVSGHGPWRSSQWIWAVTFNFLKLFGFDFYFLIG